MKSFFFLYFFLLSLGLRAQGLDYSVNGETGLPLTLGVNLWAGYGKVIWGTKSKGSSYDEPQWKYGYLRPHIRLHGSPGVGKVDFRLDLFPISLAGITIGQVYAVRDRNYKSEFNCDYLSCQSTLSRSFIEGKFKGGYADFFAVLTLRADALTAGVRNRGFVDESSKLEGAEGYDLLTSGQVQLGYRLRPRWPTGFYAQSASMERTRAWSNEFGLFARYDENEEWRYRFMLGLPERRTKGRHLSVNIQVSWIGLPSVEL